MFVFLIKSPFVLFINVLYIVVCQNRTSPLLTQVFTLPPCLVPCTLDNICDGRAGSGTGARRPSCAWARGGARGAASRRWHTSTRMNTPCWLWPRTPAMLPYTGTYNFLSSYTLII